MATRVHISRAMSSLSPGFVISCKNEWVYHHLHHAGMWGMRGAAHCLTKLWSKPLRMKAKVPPTVGHTWTADAEAAPSPQGEASLGCWQVPAALAASTVSSWLPNPLPTSQSLVYAAPSFWALLVYVHLSPKFSSQALGSCLVLSSLTTGPDLALPST